MELHIIHTWPIPVLVGVILVLAVAATELGYRVGRRQQRQRSSDRDFAMTSALKASIIGLIALLLGFSFSITSSRFSERTRMVLEEANALSTCYERASLIADPARTRIRSALRRYTELRIEQFEEHLDEASFLRSEKAADATLNELWAAVTEAVRVDAELANTSQIVSGANRVIELSTTRTWAMLNRLPASVIVLLGLCMVISGGLVGHSSAEAGARHLGLWLSLNVLILLVVFVILDFDRPRRGFIHVNHEPMDAVLVKIKN